MSHLSSIDREYSSVLRLGGGFAGGGGKRSAQFIVLCLGSLGVRTPFFWPWLPAQKMGGEKHSISHKTPTETRTYIHSVSEKHINY